jgi:hypothetical protein
MTQIANGSTERVRATALDSAGAYLTGLTDVLIEIRRKSDGFYFDFNDTTFKSTGWTTRQLAMTEMDATNSAGAYYYDFNTASLSDDDYFVRVSQTGSTMINVPQEGELKVGGFITDITSVLADTNELQSDDVPTLISTLDAVVDTVKAETVLILADTAVIGAAGAGLTALATQTSVNTIDGIVDAILIDTNELQVDDIPAKIAALDVVVDTVKAETVLILADTADMQPRVAAIETDTSTTLQAELDAIQAAVITNAAGVDIAADIISLKAETALIVADTNELQVDDVPTLISNLDVVVDTIKAETVLILSDTNDILVDTADIQPNYATSTAIATVDANVDTMVAGIITGTAQTGTLSTTACSSDLTGYTTDQLIGRIITFYGAGPSSGESSDITDYVSTNGVITYTSLTLAPENTNPFKIT